MGHFFPHGKTVRMKGNIKREKEEEYRTLFRIENKDHLRFLIGFLVRTLEQFV